MTIDFKAEWDNGKLFHEFVAGAQKNKELWEGVHRLARLPEWAATAIPMNTTRRMLAIVEDWCGDAVNTVPVLARWAESLPNLDLRLVERDKHPNLMDRYLTGAARSIPIVINLDEDFQELGHWGPRPTELQDWVMATKDTMPKEERYPLVRKWYARDHGESTIREVLEAMAIPAGKA
jgi:hypothetical protein